LPCSFAAPLRVCCCSLHHVYLLCPVHFICDRGSRPQIISHWQIFIVQVVSHHVSRYLAGNVLPSCPITLYSIVAPCAAPRPYRASLISASVSDSNTTSRALHFTRLNWLMATWIFQPVSELSLTMSPTLLAFPHLKTDHSYSLRHIGRDNPFGDSIKVSLRSPSKRSLIPL
jgi:hypothetical protein